MSSVKRLYACTTCGAPYSPCLCPVDSTSRELIPIARAIELSENYLALHYLSPGELASILHVSRRTITRRIRDGTILARTIPGTRKLRIPKTVHDPRSIDPQSLDPLG